MGRLRNPQHEAFCRAIVIDGKDLQEAYVIAGYQRDRANHNKLRRRADVSARIEELTQERDAAARAARTPIADVLTELASHGIDRLADLFEGAPDGLVVRNLRVLRVETALALLNALHDGTGIAWERPAATSATSS
jgi:LDH2 family malate/lactate/ureidoglycolate dehydrogenase